MRVVFIESVYFSKKIKAMKIYKSEIGKFPFSRSSKVIESKLNGVVHLLDPKSPKLSSY